MPLSNLTVDKRIYHRYLIAIAMSATAVIVSAYAFFLLRNILIIYPAAHILPLAVAVEISILVPVFLVLLLRYPGGESGILPLAVIILLLWAAPQVTFILNVEHEYRAVEDDYSSFVGDRLRAGESVPAISWNLSKKYLESFSSAGNDIKNPVPVRSVFPENGVYTFHLLLYHYIFGLDGLEKLTVADRRGNCSEYAGAVSFLVNATLKIPTRFVIVYGYDHKFAEVKTKDGWFVLDPLKTTPDYPVRAPEYSEHLKVSNPQAYEQITGISSLDGESLLLSHGFYPAGESATVQSERAA